MSATGLDLPVLMSEEHIRRREFVVARRGYDTAQVREFLEHVADQVRQLEAMLKAARQEAETAARTASKTRTDPYGAMADRIAGVIRAADQEAEAIRRDAKRDSETILAEARADADRIRADAEARASEIRSEADEALSEVRAQANRALSGLSTKREALVEQLATMQERLVVVARDLESAIGVPGPVEMRALEDAEVAGSSEPPAAMSPWAIPSERGAEVGDSPETPDEPAPGGPETGEPAAEGLEAPMGRSEAAQGEAIQEEAIEDETIVLHELEEPSGGDLAGPTEDREDDLDDDAQMALLDDAFEGLWEGPQGLRLEVPDMPPLDLDWGDVEGDERP
jgi:DivIVA domain-containing protein